MLFLNKRFYQTFKKNFNFGFDMEVKLTCHEVNMQIIRGYYMTVGVFITILIEYANIE